MNDLKFILRQLIRNPGFTAVAVLTLAIGIGANTAVFSFVDHLLVRALPVHDPHRLVTIAVQLERSRADQFHYPFFKAMRDGNSVFEGLLAHSDMPLNVTVNGQAERAQGMVVSENYFSVLGLRPALGAFITTSNAGEASHAVAVISHRFWTRRFGADPGVIGRQVNINAHPFIIAGVAPPEFAGTVPGLRPSVYIPIEAYPRIAPFGDPLESRFLMWLNLLGRLKPGVPREQAQASLRVLAEQIKSEHPENVESTITLDDGSRGHSHELSEARLPLILVQITVALLLAIACANVANLLLARATMRRREIAIRRSVGASRGQIIRLLLLESGVISLAGGAAGLLVAFWLKDMIASFPPSGGSGALDVPLDGRIFAFALAVSTFTGLLFGAAPAWQSARTELLDGLKAGASATAGAHPKWMLRHALVVLQAALAVTVLTAAGLCLRSVQKLTAVDPGFEPAHVLLCSVDVASAHYTTERGLIFYERLLDRIRSLPGVESAGLARNAMLSRSSSGISVHRLDDFDPPTGEPFNLGFDLVSDDYFRTIGAQVLRGREFTAADISTAPLVAIVNETLAKTYWPGQDPIGKRIYLPDMRAFAGHRAPSVALTKADEIAREVVGVVQDGKYRSLSESPRPMMFWPVTQNYDGRLTLHVRSTLPAARVAESIQREVHALDAHLPVFNVQTLEQRKTDSLFLQRMLASLLGGFGAIGLMLSALGIYGVLAYAVSQRTREIGIRLALGARHGTVLRLVILQGMTLALIGLAAGSLSAFGMGRLMRSLLFGVEPADPLTFGAITIVLTTVALLACWIPARRAARVNPMEALRNE